MEPVRFDLHFLWKNQINKCKSLASKKTNMKDAKLPLYDCVEILECEPSTSDVYYYAWYHITLWSSITRKTDGF